MLGPSHLSPQSDIYSPQFPLPSLEVEEDAWGLGGEAGEEYRQLGKKGEEEEEEEGKGRGRVRLG